MSPMWKTRNSARDPKFADGQVFWQWDHYRGLHIFLPPTQPKNEFIHWLSHTAFKIIHHTSTTHPSIQGHQVTQYCPKSFPNAPRRGVFYMYTSLESSQISRVSESDGEGRKPERHVKSSHVLPVSWRRGLNKWAVSRWSHRGSNLGFHCSLCCIDCNVKA